MTLPLRRIFEVEALRTSAWAGAKVHELAEFGRFKKHPLSTCWRLLYQGNTLVKYKERNTCNFQLVACNFLIEFNEICIFF